MILRLTTVLLFTSVLSTRETAGTTVTADVSNSTASGETDITQLSGSSTTTDQNTTSLPTTTPFPKNKTLGRNEFGTYWAQVIKDEVERPLMINNGILVSRRHVLQRASFALEEEKKIVNPSIFFVIFNQELQTVLNKEIATRIKGIFLHPNYRSSESLDYDLAVFITADNVVFTSTIMPAWMPRRPYNEEIKLIRDSKMPCTTIGRRKYSLIMKDIQIYLKPIEKCKDDSIFNEITDELYLCGSLTNYPEEENPGVGLSGGMVCKLKGDTVFLALGLDVGHPEQNTQNATVFLRLDQQKDFVKSFLEMRGGEEAVGGMGLATITLMCWIFFGLGSNGGGYI